MTILEGVNTLKGKPAEIPNCSRNDLPQFFKEMGFTKGVEIGVYKGENLEQYGPSGLEVYGIDPWRLYKDYGNPRGQKRLDDQYQMSLDRIKPYPNLHIIRKTSMEALDDFEDGSLDFVYIDGNHQFAYVAEDIYHWAIKLKQGGVLSGHDYARYKSKSICGGCHAKEVVDAYVYAYNIPNFWVLGRKRDDNGKLLGANLDPTKGEVRDQWRSWMMIKNHETPQHILPN